MASADIRRLLQVRGQSDATATRRTQAAWPHRDPTIQRARGIIANRTGHLAGIAGRLNPILDHLDRTYLYADNVAINDGMPQPVHFKLNEPVRLTDSLGNNATLWFREMRGASCVFDYRLDKGRSP